MIGNHIGHRLDPYLEKIFVKTCGRHIHPNGFTLLGLVASLAASFLILIDSWTAAGLIFALSGVFDLLDGIAARNLGKVTAFGGFLDSVLDRYSDLSILLALVIHSLQRGDAELVIVGSLASMGTALIPYARARAEALGVPCQAGLLERAERVILLCLGILFGWTRPVLWILAILSHITVAQRIYYVWNHLSKFDIKKT
jgi:CDP-diacylglycerol--glycerol-3-phosphate 3-phosphatidyltransferase